MSTIETKPYDGKHVTNTLAGLNVQNSIFLGLPITYKEKSTLNEHLGILADRRPEALAKPEARFLCVGNGGHIVTATDNLATPIPVKHNPTDAAPYNIIPLVLRPVDKDLGDDVRERYALRRIEEHGGRRYWAYYMKRLDFRGVRTMDYYTRIRDGQKSVREFEYSDINLYPTPPASPDYDYEVDDKLAVSDGDYVHTSAETTVPLDQFDIQELLNVATVLYGDPRKAVVSEFCLCTGIDTVATGESMVGSPFQYNEVIGAQVAVFLTTFTNVAYANRSLAYVLNIGQTEPMVLAAGQVPQQTGSASGGTLL